MSGPFVKCLAEKCGAGPAKMHPLAFAAALSNRRYAAERLGVGRAGIKRICPKAPRQPLSRKGLRRQIAAQR